MAIRFTQHARKRLSERLPLPIKKVEHMVRNAVLASYGKSFLYKDNVNYLKYDDIIFVTKNLGMTGGKTVVITVFRDN